MSFVSWPFVVLFFTVMAARLTFGRAKNEKAFIALLVVSGAVFYAWHVPVYLFILLASTSVDYAASLALGRIPSDRIVLRRVVLAASLGTNLGLLGFFKYGNLLLYTLSEVAGAFHLSYRLPELGLVLPIGISFYTFEAMSYTIDVYRGELAPVRSFWRFFLFISFFPHLVAGPIVRAHQFLPQISRPRRLRWPVFCEGIWLITTGFFLKMVCADNLAVYVDQYWRHGYRHEADAAYTTWLALMFSGQIFADFAGYSNIARGVAYLLGYRLPVNFNAPYIATSFKNFWERWHITLSRWLRDYLYLPLGGSRRGRRRTYLNLVLVMLLGGLWHGAAYRFVVWGGLHGGALACERLLGLHRDPSGGRQRAVRAAWFVVVQGVVLLAWVFFRSDSLFDGIRFARNLVSLNFRPLPRAAFAGSLFLFPLVGVHIWTSLRERGYTRPLGPVARAAFVGAMAYAILALHTSASDFIYFQF